MLFKRKEKREKRKGKRKGRIKIFLRSREEVRLRKAFPWGRWSRRDRMRGGTQLVIQCRGGGMPRPLNFDT